MTKVNSKSGLIFLQVFMFLTSCTSLSNKLENVIDCGIVITDSTINFGSCYNGLSIVELQVADTNITLYPQNFRKLKAYELFERNVGSVKRDSNVEIDFTKRSNIFFWKYFDQIEENDDEYYASVNYLRLDTIGAPFKCNTWYLLNFFNPQFRIFVHSDSTCKLKVIKEKFNTNF